MDMKKIGELIAARRRALTYTQDELGEVLGVSGKAISKWERGLSCPDVSLMNRIAVELKISVKELMDGRLYDVTSSNSIQKEEPISALEVEPYETVTFSRDEKLGVVSPYLFGNNLEHARSCISGGLSAQMLKNRKFVGKPSAMEGVAQNWYVIGEKTYCCFSKPYTRHHEFYHMKRRMECNAQSIRNYSSEECGMGQHELCVAKGETYEFAVVLQSDADAELSVSLTNRWGKEIYAMTSLSIPKGTEWKRYTAILTSSHSDDDADLRITFRENGCVRIGSVSLMNRENFRGMRLDVIDALKEMGVKVLRWPGGNFAGEYNWFDGLLPVDERAPFESYTNLETQPHTLGYDFHEINTDDFLALCRKIGAEPFITINLAWNTPEESVAWVEYCNGDATTEYGSLRAERGNPEPYNVTLWSLGNEFGYGHMEGDNSAGGYARLAKESALRMRELYPNLTLCSSGPYPNAKWAEYSAKPLSEVSQFVAVHYYSQPQTTSLYSDSARFREEYDACIASVEVARDKIIQTREQIRETGLKISFDEWNLWYGWHRPSSVVDGLYTAMMMHMIIDEARKSDVGIACQFAAVNESAIHVTPRDASLTATGQALAMMKGHINGILRYVGNCVVATEREGTITMTVINPSYDQPKTVTFPCNAQTVCVLLYETDSLLPPSHFSIRKEILSAKDGTCKLELPAHTMALVTYKD